MQQQCSGPGGLTLDLERGRNSRRRTAPKQLGAEKAAAATLPPGLSQGQALLLDFTMILQYFLLGSAGNGFPDISFTGLDQGHKRLPGNLHFHPLSRLRATSGSYQELFRLFMLWSVIIGQKGTFLVPHSTDDLCHNTKSRKSGQLSIIHTMLTN